MLSRHIKGVCFLGAFCGVADTGVVFFIYTSCPSGCICWYLLEESVLVNVVTFFLNGGCESKQPLRTYITSTNSSNFASYCMWVCWSVLLQEAYFRYMAENPTAGVVQEEEEDNLEYDSDGNPIAPSKKIIDPLPPIDHSEVGGNSVLFCLRHSREQELRRPL